MLDHLLYSMEGSCAIVESLLKKILIVGALFIFLTGCGSSVNFKDDDDRRKFTDQEIEAVEKHISALDGVESFDITPIDNGVYAVLIVEDKSKAKKLAVEAFNSMWRETTGFVDLFVKESGKEDILIQAFKPPGTDKENKWDILL